MSVRLLGIYVVTGSAQAVPDNTVDTKLQEDISWGFFCNGTSFSPILRHRCYLVARTLRVNYVVPEGVDIKKTPFRYTVTLAIRVLQAADPPRVSGDNSLEVVFGSRRTHVWPFRELKVSGAAIIGMYGTRSGTMTTTMANSVKIGGGSEDSDYLPTNLIMKHIIDNTLREAKITV
jgi:hypothetical protein